MNKNVKIAKQLIKLAKQLIATDGSIDNLAQGIYDCIQDGQCSYEFYLPSGAVFCITDASTTDGYHETAIVTDFNFGMPTPNAFWFYDMNDIDSIHEDDSLQKCKHVAQQIFELDKNFRFDTSDKENILDYIDKLYSKEWSNYYNQYDEYTTTTDKVYEYVEQHFDKFVELLNKNWSTQGVRCFQYAMDNMYELMDKEEFDY